MTCSPLISRLVRKLSGIPSIGYCVHDGNSNLANFFLLSHLTSNVPEPVTRSQLLDLCCNFVVYDDELDIFRFAHLSVKEFLETLPLFSPAISHSLAAEHCLAYVMRRAQSLTIQRFLADHYSLPDLEYMRLDFESYALYHAMKHCKEAGVDQRAQGSLQTLLHMFFLDERGASSPLDLWLATGAVKSNLGAMLCRLRRNAVTKAENNLQCGFLIACLFGLPEIISQYLRSPLPTEIMAKGLLLATDEEHEDVIAALKVKSQTVFTRDVLICAFRELETKASEDQLLLLLFVDGGKNVPITDEVIQWACRSVDCMAFLVLCHPISLDETENLLVAAASDRDSTIFELLIRHTNTLRVNESMIKSAGNSRNLYTLLRQAHLEKPSLMKLALGNVNFDKRCMEFLESRVGRIHADLDILKVLVACFDPWVWEEMLLRRGARVTEDSIFLATQYCRFRDEGVGTLKLHLMNNTTVQLSQELVERVMDLHSTVNVIEILMHHLTPAFKLTENLIFRAMDLDPRGESNIVPLLLAQDPAFRITERLIERTDSFPLSRMYFLTSLLSHNEFKISDRIFKQEILRFSPRVGDFTPNIITSKEPDRATSRDTEEDLRPLRLLLDHDTHFRITHDLLEQLTWRHQPSEETMDVLWARLVKDGNAEEVIGEGLEQYRQGKNEHGSITWALLLSRKNRVQARVLTPVLSGE